MYCSCRRKKFGAPDLSICQNCGLKDQPREFSAAAPSYDDAGADHRIYYGTTPQDAEDAAREAKQRFPRDRNAQATYVKRVVFGAGASGPGGGNQKKFADAMRRGMETLHAERNKLPRGVKVNVYPITEGSR